jgi:hypothetical protein
MKERVKLFRITVVLLALTGSAFASDVLSDTPENRAKAVDEYLSVVPVKDLVNDMTEKVAAAVPENNREAFKSMLTKHLDLDALVAAEKQSLAKIFTVGELKAMTAYLSTPEGKSSMKKMGAYFADLMPVLQAELQKAMQATMQETKSESQAPAATPSPTTSNQ